MTYFVYLLWTFFAFFVRVIEVKVPCDPESFQFTLKYDKLQVNEPYIFAITNREEIGCAINASFLWKIYEVAFGELIRYKFSDRVLEFVTPIKTFWNRIYFTNIDFKTVFGKMFVLQVILIPRPTHYSSYRMHAFKVQLEKYILKILTQEKHYLGTGSLWLRTEIKREREGNESIVLKNVTWVCFPPFLNVEPPSTLNWEVSELNLRPHWKHNCTVTVTVMPGEWTISSSAAVEIIPFLSDPLLEIKCVKNCPTGKAFKVTRLRYMCHANCDENAAWFTEPYDKKIKEALLRGTNAKKQSVTIAPGTFKHGMSYLIVVVLGEDSATYTLTFTLPIHNISVVCKQFCFKRHRPISFKVECVGECKGLEYKWEALPYPYVWKWPNLNVSSFSSNDFLVFPPYYFPYECGASLKVSDINSEAFLNFTVDYYSPIVVIKCISAGKNCTRPDAKHEVTLRVICLMFCDVPSYSWRFTPYQPNFKWREYASNDNLLVTIPPNTYAGNDLVRVSLYADDFHLVKELEIWYDSPPFLSIECHKNCLPFSNESNPYAPVILAVKCVGSCTNIVLKWSIYPMPTSAIMIEDFAIIKGMMFFIPGGSYQGGQDVSIKVEASGAQANFSLLFLRPATKIAMYCVQNCLKPANPSLDLKLEVACLQWCDEVDFHWSILDNTTFIYNKHIILSPRNRSITFESKFLEYRKYLETKVVSFPFYSEAIYRVNIKPPMPVFDLFCTYNCDPSLVHFSVFVQAICSIHCSHVRYTWSLYIGSENMPFEYYALVVQNDTIKLLPNIFNDRSYLRVEVIANEEVSANITLYYIKYAPSLVLSCSPEPCDHYFYVQQAMNISVKCLSQCYIEDYTWEIFPRQTKDFWFSHIILGIKNKSLTFLPGSFQENTEINVSLSLLGYTVHTTIKFIILKSEISVECVRNCNHSNPYEDVILKGSCLYHCENAFTYRWQLIPLPKNMTETKLTAKLKFRPEFIQLTIPKNLYEDGDIVSAKLISNNAISVHKISFVVPTPRLTIVCSRNTEFYPYQETVLEVRCLEHCIGPHNYQWTVIPFLSYLEQQKEEKAIIIAPYTYSHNTLVNFTVQLGKGSTTLFARFSIGTPNYLIKCINCYFNNMANPNLRTILKIDCLTNCELKTESYRWEFDQDPISKLIDINGFGDMATIFKNTFMNNTRVNIWVYRGFSVKKIAIHFLIPDPILRIVCGKNCGHPNPYFDVIYLVRCFQHCLNLTYDWSITPQLRHFSYEKNTRLSTDNTTFLVKKLTYRNKERVVIRVEGGGTIVEKKVIFTVSPPSLQINCVNCENTHPSSRVVITVFCTQFCLDVYYIWSIAPKPPGFIWGFHVVTSPENDTFTINPNTYSFNSLVTVTLSSTLRYAYYVTIAYAGFAPTLNITCLSNCEFQPLEEVQFLVTCQGKCKYFITEVGCSVEPKIMYHIAAKTSNQVIVNIINEDYFESEIKVNLYCNYRHVNASYLFSFDTIQWNGKCVIKPDAGVAIESVFSIDCVNFVKNATFKVYQILGSMETAILLVVTENTYMPDIYLAYHYNSTILIHVGIDWHNMASISFNVAVLPFTRYVKNSIEERLWALQKISYINSLFIKKKHESAMQLASAIVVFLLDRDHNSFYDIKQLLIDTVIPYIIETHPLQSLHFVYTLFTNIKSEINLLVYSQCMEVVNIASQQAVRLNRTKLDFADIADDMAFFIIEFSILVLNESTNFFYKIDSTETEKKRINPDYEVRMHYKFAKIISDSVLNCLDIATVLKQRANDTINYSFTLSEFTIVGFPKNSEITYKLQSNLTNSYVLLNPQMYEFNLKEDYAIGRTGYFRKNLFSWLLPGTFQNGEIFYFSVTDKYANHVEGSFQAHVNLRHGKMTTSKFINLKNQFFIIGIRVPISFVLELNLTAKNVTVGISRYRTNEEMTKSTGFSLNGSRKFFIPGNNYYIYVGIFGTGFVNISFTGLICLSWHNYSSNWDNKSCTVSTEPNQQTDTNFITCNCKGSSLITANSIPLSYKTDFEQTTFQGYKIAKNLTALIIILCCLMIMLVCFAIFFFIAYTASPRILYLLPDNDINDTEIYLIAIQTGLVPKAGTTAQVCIQLKGTKGASKAHILNVPTERYTEALQRNSYDCFVMLTSVPLGDIKCIRLWLDASGERPEWFCDTVVVRHLISRKRYLFVVSRWFSHHRPPYTTNGIFKPLKRRSLVPLRTKMEATLRDYYNVFGMYTARTHTNRLENAIMAIVSLLIIMTIAIVLVNHITSTFNIFRNVLICVVLCEIVIIVIDVLIRNSI